MNRKTVLNILNNESGIALLITLSIIVILFAVSLELNQRVNVSITDAETAKIDYRLMQMAESGINIAKAILIKDAVESRIDSVQEEWADPEYLAEMANLLDWDEGKLELIISDEMGKIQINALINEYPGHSVNQNQKRILKKFFSLFINPDKSEDARDPAQIINCLVDWLDSRDGEMITGISGAESSYYESLEVPYQCANREFFSVKEFLLVKGISSNLLSKPESFENMLLDQETQDRQLELGDFFTVFGADKKKTKEEKKYSFPGKININTAPVEVVSALLPFGRQDFAEMICEYRVQKPDKESDYVNNISKKGWYADIAGLTQKEQQTMEKNITYSSNVFSLESRAVMDGRSITLKSVLARKKDKKGRWYCQKLRQQIQ